MLFTALIDDGINCQLIRVKHVLIGIGIKPLPPKSQLIKAIKFSRSSDLAFLWFLYDSIYRTADDHCSQKKYSFNERVILSCICHLDMLVTFRELDKILPKPDASCNSREIIQKKHKYSHILPPKPVPPLDIYEIYKDPFYVIENESNRWFAIEGLVQSESYCIAQKILAEEISKIPKTLQNSKSLCAQHLKESSKFYQTMKKLTHENQQKDFLEENHKHLSIFERGIAYGMFVEFQKYEKEFNEKSERIETEIIVKSLLHQVINNSFNRRFIHLCEKCEEMSHPNSHEKYEFPSDDDDICNKIPKTSSYDPSIVKYYQRPSIDGNHPLSFDYEKIFSLDVINDYGVVKNSINTALKLDKYLTVDNAITTCLRDMWRITLKKWNEKRQADIEERQQRVVANCSEFGKNKEKILKLLREAIAIMRKNPKFVLAALPQCHRLPILREWILQRYGFKYIDQSLIKNKYGMDGKYF